MQMSIKCKIVRMYVKSSQKTLIISQLCDAPLPSQCEDKLVFKQGERERETEFISVLKLLVC